MVSDRSPSRPGEFALIASVFARLSRSAPGAFGLEDDAAALAVEAGQELVVTVDTVIEGVHFLRDDAPELVARKSLRVNLSDLAAKGARPKGYLLAVTLAPWVDEAWLRSFAGGLDADQHAFGIALIGGDTTASPGPLTLSITAMGSVPTGKMIRRHGARPGERVFVTGTLGDAGAGLAVLKGEGGALPTSAREHLTGRYRLPQPRLEVGTRLRDVASAGLDVSDGLLADLGHIAEVSGVHIAVDAARIPLSAELTSLWGFEEDAILRAATAGDDYEIAFSASADAGEAIARIAKETGVAIHEIGRVEKGSDVALLNRNGNAIEVARPGYAHR